MRDWSEGPLVSELFIEHVLGSRVPQRFLEEVFFITKDNVDKVRRDSRSRFLALTRSCRKYKELPSEF